MSMRTCSLTFFLLKITCVFSSDKNIETIGQLAEELKRYVELQKRGLQIDFVSKLSQLAAAVVVGAIVFLLSGLALIFLSMMAASAITAWTGSQTAAYALVVLFYVVVGVVVLANRRKWIMVPLVNFLAGLFLTDKNEK